MKFRLILTASLFLALSSIASSQPAEVAGGAPDAESRDSANPERPIFDVFALIDRLADEMDREFIVHPGLRASMLGWSTAGEDADFDTLQALLRASQFAAIQVGDQIRIVHEAIARAEPSRILQDDDRGVSDHEIVTRVLDVSDIPVQTNSPAAEAASIAPQLVPVLRPMMSTQLAQLAAIPGTNKLIIVDRYDNVRRITAVIDALRR